MTEREWLACPDPAALLAFLRDRGGVSDRKLRLVAVACARRAWAVIDDLGRAAVEVAECFTDGLTGAEELRAARLACRGSGGQSAWYAAATDPAVAARNAALSAGSGAPNPQAEAAAQADLLREIVGNPFRPVAFEPAWRTRTVTELALRMYEAREFGVMTKLADALREAGCENEPVLDHCRGPGPHVRGCWVVDLVLGKA